MANKIYNVILTAVLILTSVVAAILLSPKIFGFKTYAVSSGSMEPAMHVGSLAFISETRPDKIRTGDIITFKMDGSGSLLATHRVIYIDNEVGAFVTKGDANKVSDGPVNFDRVVGKMIFSIPYLGYLSVFIKTWEGILAVTFLLIAIVLVTFIPEILKSSIQ